MSWRDDLKALADKSSTAGDRSLGDLYSQVASRCEQEARRDRPLMALARDALDPFTRLQGGSSTWDLTPGMTEAFHAQYPHVDLAKLTEKTLGKYLSGWKGKYFEILVRDRLNAGETLGDWHLGKGEKAVLAASPNQPGWDLEIVDRQGHALNHLQLKATHSLTYLKEALEKYPDIEILATHDLAEHHLEGVQWSDTTVADLQGQLLEASEQTGITPFTFLPGALTLAVITLSEGRRVLIHQSDLLPAVKRGLERAGKATPAAIASGLCVALGADALAPGVGLATSLAVKRMETGRDLQKTVDRHLAALNKVQKR